MSWRYTVNVPLWINGKDNEGESVVLYRVNVILQAPDAPANLPPKAPFFVLRRYSHFRQLYEQLKTQLPHVMRERGLQPPPKHTIHLGSPKEMQDRRREELERWLWRLISKPEVARSQALRSFLEWDKAVARFQHQSHGGAAPMDSSHSPTQGVEAGHLGSDHGDFDDTRSEVSGFSAAPSSAFSHLMGPVQEPVAIMGHMGGASGEASGSGAAPAMRLGFRLETRGDVRRLVDVLEQRLAQSGRDMRAAASEVQLLTEANRMMGQRVVELEGLLQGGRSSREVQLEKEMAEVKLRMAESAAAHDAELEDVNARLAASQDIRLEMSSRLADATSKLAAANAEVVKATEAAWKAQAQVAEMEARMADIEASSSRKVSMLTDQLAKLQQQAATAQDENKELLSKLRDWRISPQPDNTIPDSTTSTSAVIPSESEEAAKLQREEQLQQQLQEAAARAKAAEGQLGVLQEQAAKEREKVRSDQVLLAREIKKLRAELLAATQAQAHVEEEQNHQQQMQPAPEAWALQVQQLTQQLEAAGAKVQQLSEQFAQHEARAVEDAAQIRSLEQQLEAAAAKVQQLSEQLVRQDAQVLEHAATIRALQQQRQAATESMQQLSEQLAQREALALEPDFQAASLQQQQQQPLPQSLVNGVVHGEHVDREASVEWELEVQQLQSQVSELQAELAASRAASQERQQCLLSGMDQSQGNAEAERQELQELRQQLAELQLKYEEEQRLAGIQKQQLDQALQELQGAVKREEKQQDVDLLGLQVATSEAMMQEQQQDVKQLSGQQDGQQQQQQQQLADQLSQAVQQHGDAEQLKQQLAECQAQLEQARQHNSGLSEQLHDIQLLKQQLIDCQAQLGQHMQEQPEAIEQLQGQLADCQAELHQAKLELQARVAAFEQEKAAAVEQAGAEGREMELQQQLAVLRVELQEAGQQQAHQAADLEQQLRHLRQLLSAKEAELAEAGARVEEVRAGAAGAAASREAELSARLVSLEVEMAEMAGVAAARAEKAASLAADHAAAVEGREGAMRQIVELEGKLQEEEQLVESLQGQVLLLGEEVAALKLERGKLAASKEAADTATAAAEAALHDAHEQLVQLQAKLDASQARVESLAEENQSLVEELNVLKVKQQESQPCSPGTEEASPGAGHARPSGRADADQPVAHDHDLELQAELDGLDAAQVSELVAQVGELQAELDRHQASNAALLQQLAAQEAEVQSLREDLATSRQNIAATAAAEPVVGGGQQLQQQEQLLAASVSEGLRQQLSQREEQLATLEQRLAVLLTVEQQARVLQEQVGELQQLQGRMELQAQQQQQHTTGAAATADLLSFMDSEEVLGAPIASPQPGMLDRAASSVAAPTVPAAAGMVTVEEDDLVLDLAGLMTMEAKEVPKQASTISSSIEPGSFQQAAASQVAVATAVHALEADLEAVVSAAVAEAQRLLRELRDCEEAAAKLVAAGLPQGAASADSALDILLASFAELGSRLQAAQSSARGGLRQPSLLAPASAAVRAAELQVRSCLADAMEELSRRGASLNEARCDQLLANLTARSAPAVPAPPWELQGQGESRGAGLWATPRAGSPRAGFPAPAAAAPLPGTQQQQRTAAVVRHPSGVQQAHIPQPALHGMPGGYHPPTFIAPSSESQPHVQQQQQQQQPQASPAYRPQPGGANVLGALGQRMSAHLSGLGLGGGPQGPAPGAGRGRG